MSHLLTQNLSITYDASANGVAWALYSGANGPSDDGHRPLASGWALDQAQAQAEAVEHLHIAARWLTGQQYGPILRG